MFDILDPITLHTLLNNVVIGIMAAFLFVVVFHITMKNPTIGRKDLFFMLAGPAVGMVGTVLGLPQGELIMMTFTANMGLGGIKDFAKMISKYKNGEE